MKKFFAQWFKSPESKNDRGATPSVATHVSTKGDETGNPVDDAKRLAKAGEVKKALALLAPLAADMNAGPQLLMILGNCYLINGQPERAIEAMERAHTQQPSNPAITLNLANALRDSGNLPRAESLLHSLVAQNQLLAEAFDLLGVLRLDSDDPAAAIDYFERALTHAPGYTRARFNRSCALLTIGRSIEAWADHELRAATAHRATRPINTTTWHGEKALDKSLFVYAEQGIGEEILFASCFNAASAHFRQCTVECSEKLQRLFSQSFPNIHFLGRNWHNEYALPPQSAGADVVIAEGSLLRWLRPDPMATPHMAPYLKADAQRIQYWRERLATHGRAPYIGLCWRGGTRFTRQRFRSLAPRELEPLFKALPQATFVSLLHTATPDELSELHALSAGRLIHVAGPLVDMAETAALMSALDLTISIPTTVVYLASALGVPVWACTTRGAGWKYGYTGDQSMWLPGARLFRQHAHFDWPEVIRRVASELPRWHDRRK